MKKEKNFYYFLTMILFIMCFTTSIILACRTIQIGKLTLTGSILFYPMTYFLAILFSERYGKEKTIMMFNYAVFSLIIMVAMITITSTLPIAGGTDKLGILFNMDYRIVFASIVGFYVSQYLNITIYYYLTGYRGFKFLISGVIAITIDALLFTCLANIGILSFSDMVLRFANTYIMDVLMIIVYSLCFAYIIDSVIKCKNNAEQLENKKNEEITKKTVKPKTKTTKKTVKKESIKSNKNK